ncbi:MAG: GNAT family N-acetyltransferase [Bacteroidota bacterium]|nr:GNAT family N-acetyltransferase [Bacteroidota bacterium]
MIFSTERLVITPLGLEDLDAFHDLQGDERVMAFTGQKAMTRDESIIDLQRVIHHYDQPLNTFRVWAIRFKEDPELTGTCALIRNMKGEYEIGFRIRHKFWRRGIASEVTKALIQYAFKELKLPELVAYVDRENHASIRILQKHMPFIREYYDPEYNSVDREYRLKNTLKQKA